MDEISIIGLDLAKRVFQAHGMCSKGSTLFRRKLSRSQLLEFLAKQPSCIVAMEACASAHFWGRAIQELGHDVRLIPPIYVKPFVKRQKNDAADAEAIAEAAARPNMRFVALKSSSQQAGAMAFRTRDLLVRQRTQLINALRGHLAEHGVVAPQGVANNVRALEAAVEGAEQALDLLVIEMARLYLQQIATLAENITTLEKVLRQEAANATTTARLLTVPGIGHVMAMAIEAFAPPMETFRRGRDFAAWLGLAWPCPTPALNRRQAGPGQDVQDGPAGHPAIADHRRDEGCSLGFAQIAARRILAIPHARAQAANADSHSFGQQDGSSGLGDAYQR